MEKIGFIGLGIMGSRMCKNLIKSGYDVIVYNRTREKAEKLAELGAEVANSPKEVGLRSSIVFTMLSNPEVVERIALGSEGFLPHMRTGAIWVNSSTVNPSFSKRMGEVSKKYGVRFVDAPVLGSKDAAESAKLIFLVGADEKDLGEIKPLLEKMGQRIIHVGGVGAGSAMKMVVNLMLAHAMIAFSEAIALGESMGLDKNFLIDTLTNLPVSAPFLSRKGKKVKEMDFEAEFPLELMLKDLHLITLTGYENNTPLPVTNVVKEIYALAKRNGLGRLDFSSIYKIYKSFKE